MTDSRELWMELVAAAALVSFMEYRDETVRSLAAKAVVRGRDGKHKALSPALIGHLRSGRRRTCSVSSAKAIEKALQAPPGLLFQPRSSSRAA